MAARSPPGPAATLKELTGRGWKWIATTAAPTVPTWIIVKAIARSKGADAVPILVSALDDGALPLRTRLTAASALTLASTVEAEVAIARHARFLDGARAGLSSALIDTIQLRRDAEALVAPINKVHAWMETGKLASNAVAAYAFRHSLIPGLVPAVSYGARDSDVHAARRTALKWTAEHVAEHQACWDVYRGVAYELEWMVDDEEWRPLKSIMTPAEEATLAAQVHAATARLDRDTSCLE